MVTAVAAIGSRSRIYPVTGEPGTWRVYFDGVAIGRVRMVGETFAAESADGRQRELGYRSRSRAIAALAAMAGVEA